MRKIIPNKVVHGGLLRTYSEHYGREMIDFSANFNPFPPSFAWKPDVSILSSYPDDTYHALKEVIARRFGCDVNEICVGNGSVEVIRSFAYASIGRGDRIRIDPPTFGEYEYAVRLAGGSCVPGEPNPAVRFVCNPNNPTGELLTKPNLEKMASDARKSGYILFIDEAFIELADPAQSMIASRSPNVFVLRSLTKSFSVPGLRFGFGRGDPDLIAQIERIRPPWTVNTFAEDFVLEAFAHYDELEESRRKIAIEREWLCDKFETLGLDFTPSSTNFILLNLHRDAGEFTGEMLKKDILVRDCTSFGLPSSIRVAVRNRDENRLLIEAFEACLH